MSKKERPPYLTYKRRSRLGESFWYLQFGHFFNRRGLFLKPLYAALLLSVLLSNATPSVFHQRHIGRVLRSSCNSRGRRLASSRGREPQPGRCPPFWPDDL